jgi:hypothetical protein
MSLSSTPVTEMQSPSLTLAPVKETSSPSKPSVQSIPPTGPTRSPMAKTSSPSIYPTVVSQQSSESTKSDTEPPAGPTASPMTGTNPPSTPSDTLPTDVQVITMSPVPQTSPLAMPSEVDTEPTTLPIDTPTSNATVEIAPTNAPVVANGTKSPSSNDTAPTIAPALMNLTEPSTGNVTEPSTGNLTNETAPTVSSQPVNMTEPPNANTMNETEVAVASTGPTDAPSIAPDPEASISLRNFGMVIAVEGEWNKVALISAMTNYLEAEMRVEYDNFLRFELKAVSDRRRRQLQGTEYSPVEMRTASDHFLRVELDRSIGHRRRQLQENSTPVSVEFSGEAYFSETAPDMTDVVDKQIAALLDTARVQEAINTADIGTNVQVIEVLVAVEPSPSQIPQPIVAIDTSTAVAMSLLWTTVGAAMVGLL